MSLHLSACIADQILNRAVSNSFYLETEQEDSWATRFSLHLMKAILQKAHALSRMFTASCANEARIRASGIMWRI